MTEGGRVDGGRGRVDGGRSRKDEGWREKAYRKKEAGTTGRRVAEIGVPRGDPLGCQ